ncbi:MAG TPA: outer membrane beta-barrel protein [Candidatus Sulfotelmatobacter sp.]
MRKFIAVACFLMLFSLAAMAADYPKAEIFGGYQYTHLEGGYNGNGFNFALNGNFNDYFGITADFGAAYKSQNGVSLNNYTYTFGPVLSLRANKAYTPFVHALIGGDHATASVSGVGSASGNGYALMAGGGVDFNINRGLAFRAAQADWMLVHSNGSTSSKNLRISTGIVLKF